MAVKPVGLPSRELQSVLAERGRATSMVVVRLDEWERSFGAKSRFKAEEATRARQR